MKDKISRLEYFISKKVGKAIVDYNLIEDGDRVLVAVSGGKDSLLLLRILKHRQSWVPIEYGLIAAHIQTDYRCSGCVHSKVLEKIFKGYNLDYCIKKIKIFPPKADPPTAENEKIRVSCFWCAWNRRKTLFEIAQKFGCNKVAFGHHMDDIIQTQLMNLFFQGEISTMNPRQELFDGKVIIIRPLAYVEEDEIKRVAKKLNFPKQLCRCPNSIISRRRFVKNIISKIKKEFPDIKINIFKSLSRIKSDYLGPLGMQNKNNSRRLIKGNLSLTGLGKTKKA